jgi:hypothetical protein
MIGRRPPLGTCYSTRKEESMEILENGDQWLAAFRSGWLAHYEQTGEIDWSLYNRPTNSSAPPGPGIDLAASRLLLISSAGAFLRGRQEPFDAGNPLGDYSVRVFPSSTRLDALAIAHEHYDRAAVSEDPRVLLPLRALEDLVAEGKIGAVASSTISFMGYQPDASRVVNEMIPAILDVAQAEQAQAALLVPA